MKTEKVKFSKFKDRYLFDHIKYRLEEINISGQLNIYVNPLSRLTMGVMIFFFSFTVIAAMVRLCMSGLPILLTQPFSCLSIMSVTRYFFVYISGIKGTMNSCLS